MLSVSYIIDGSSITPQEFQKLHLLSVSPRFRHDLTEFIVYNIEDSTLISGNSNLVLIRARNHSKSSISRAIANATGIWLLVASARTIIEDETQFILTQALSISQGNVAVPFNPPPFQQKIGIRRLANIPYYMVRKDFAVDNLTLLNRPIEIVRKANHLLSLIRLDKPLNNFSEQTLMNGLIVRPYQGILKHKINTTVRICRNYLQKHKAERLRKQVKSVPFSVWMPVFIICRDRVEPLKKLISWCEDEGLKNIILIDNASTYPPLINFLSTTAYEVIQLNSNIGHTSPWQARIVDIYARDKPYIVTDPDVIPVAGSHGAVKRFCELLNEYPERTKAGFGLKIDDLPDYYELKKSVIRWEKKFWASLVEADVYDAEIDTTFAVYRPNTPYVLGPGLRTGGKYVARHEPWYVKSLDPGAEIQYYREHADKKIGSWGTDLSELTETYDTYRPH